MKKRSWNKQPEPEPEPQKPRVGFFTKLIILAFFGLVALFIVYFAPTPQPVQYVEVTRVVGQPQAPITVVATFVVTAEAPHSFTDNREFNLGEGSTLNDTVVVGNVGEGEATLDGSVDIPPVVIETATPELPNCDLSSQELVWIQGVAQCQDLPIEIPPTPTYIPPTPSAPWPVPLTELQIQMCILDMARNASCSQPWPRPISPQVFEACQNDCSINQACSGYGNCP